MKKLMRILTCVLLASVSIVAFTACSEELHEHLLTKHDSISATCQQTGNTEYYSCDCGKFFEDANAEKEIENGSWTLAITGHELGDFVYNNDATCAEDGTKTANCANCDYTETETALGTKLSHSFINYTLFEEADCKNNATEKATCSNADCDETDVRDIPNTKLDHSCDNTGFCSTCKQTFGDDYMQTLGYVARTKGVYYKSILKAITANTSKIVYVIADSDEDVAVQNVLIINSGVNYTGTITKASVVDVEADLETYVSSFDLALRYSNYFSPTTGEVKIKLLQDISFANKQDIRYAKKVILDLNGKNITSTVNAYQTPLFHVYTGTAFDITSSIPGAVIDLGVAGLVKSYGDVNVSNVEINQTGESNTDFILNYAPVVIENTKINQMVQSSTDLIKNYAPIVIENTQISVVNGKIFTAYDALTLKDGTVIDVSGILGTSLINAQGGADVLIDGATINVASFKVNGGSFFYRNLGNDFIIEKLNLTLVVDESYSSRFLNSVEGTNTTVKFDGMVYDISGNSGDYFVNADGTWVSCSFVKDINELTEAFANGGTIVLQTDVVSNKRIDVPKGKEVILNLNGHTLSAAFSNKGTSALLYNEGTLTIKNGTVISLAQYPDVDWGEEGFPTYASNTITNRGGTIIIEDGAIIENQTNVGGASYAIDNQYGWNGAPSKIIVNGGLIKAKDVAIRVCASTQDYDNYLEVNGGTITGKRAIWIHLTGGDSAVAPKATVIINDGELSCTDAEGLVIYSYSYGNSFANTNVTIKGGSFLNGFVAFGGGYKGDKETVTVTGGTFEYDVFRYLANDKTEDIFKANI